MGTVHLSGPLFDGRTQQELQKVTREMEKQVAASFTQQWMGNMNSSFRTQTPYYMTQVTNQEMPGQHVIHDRGIIYGPWLEGVGSRNKSTRFKGYWSLKRAYETTMGRVQSLCEDIMRRHLGSM